METDMVLLLPDQTLQLPKFLSQPKGIVGCYVTYIKRIRILYENSE